MPPAEPARKQTAITKSKLLLVEGRDAEVFFRSLLTYLGLAEMIQIQDFGGTSELRRHLETIVITPGFTNVGSLGIIRDAELNAQSAFQSVCGSLRNANLAEPPRMQVAAGEKPQVSVFILPDCQNSGMLETLCLTAVNEDPAIPCVEDFFGCLEQNANGPSNQHKAYLHAFMASRPKPDLLLGEAARAGYWPWDHEAFDAINAFLRAL